MVTRLEVRKHLIRSTNYLRKTGFKGYPNMFSERNLKIFNGRIDYKDQWFAEGRPLDEEEARKIIFRENARASRNDVYHGS
ncbi:MAG: hypothetical protein QXU11_00470 [Thermoproteota archaeon]